MDWVILELAERGDLAKGRNIERCLYCERTPRFRQWPGRELVIFEHKCRFVDSEKTLFPAASGEAIAEWNAGVRAMKANALKTPNVLADRPAAPLAAGPASKASDGRAAG